MTGQRPSGLRERFLIGRNEADGIFDFLFEIRGKAPSRLM